MEKQYRLPKEFATKWIAALRSGEYKQGERRLFNIVDGVEEYCCIGICGCILGATKESMKGYAKRGVEDVIADIPEELKMPISDFVSDWRESLLGRCMDMNDVEGKSFPEIADWIQDNCLLY